MVTKYSCVETRSEHSGKAWACQIKRARHSGWSGRWQLLGGHARVFYQAFTRTVAVAHRGRTGSTPFPGSGLRSAAANLFPEVGGENPHQKNFLKADYPPESTPPAAEPERMPDCRAEGVAQPSATPVDPRTIPIASSGSGTANWTRFGVDTIRQLQSTVLGRTNCRVARISPITFTPFNRASREIRWCTTARPTTGTCKQAHEDGESQVVGGQLFPPGIPVPEFGRNDPPARSGVGL